MSDKFTGHWLVSEYVFNPDGSFAGIVRQRRYLEPQLDGKTRVIQHCQPQPELASHPMGDFNGERVFDLTVEGRERLYHGPDVIGMGLPWGDSAMTGRGVWARFGHNFTSFAVLPASDRQITGGKFYNASEMIANIIGIAIPERSDADTDYPEYSGSTSAAQTSPTWHGEMLSYAANGDHLQPHTITRQYTDDRAWMDTIGQNRAITVTLQDNNGRLHISGDTTGIGKRLGWLLEMTLIPSPETYINHMEILDNNGHNLIGLSEIYRHGRLTQVDVLKLKPQTDKSD